MHQALQWPAVMDRALEERILDLLGGGELEPAAWRALGPPSFAAGVALMLASLDEAPQADLRALARQLAPGIDDPQCFNRWLALSPLKPSRLLPVAQDRLAQLRQRAEHALGGYVGDLRRVQGNIDDAARRLSALAAPPGGVTPPPSGP